MNTTFARAATTTWSRRGAISPTRCVAPAHQCLSHMSQMTMAVCFGSHFRIFSRTSKPPRSAGFGTRWRAVSVSGSAKETAGEISSAINAARQDMHHLAIWWIGITPIIIAGNDHRDTEAQRMHRESNQRAGKQIANFLIVFSVHPLCLGVSVVIPGHRNSYDCSIFTPFRSPPMKRILTLAALLFAPLLSHADEPKKLLNVPYGSHPRQVLDFYQAKSDKPAPVVFYIHGGGWQNGHK